MISNYIEYKLTISNVDTPNNIIPLTYSITSQINNHNSQLFTTLYTLKNLYPITSTLSKSDNTYGKHINLTINITS